MTLGQSLSLAACLGMLALAFTVLLRQGRSPLGLVLALLCIDMFGWNFATWAHGVSRQDAWVWLDGTLSPFTPPLALHAVLVFVGRRRSWIWLLIAAYAAFAMLAGGAVWIMARSSPAAWLAHNGWSVAYLALWLPLLVVETALLVTHLGRSAAHEEQMRTRWLLAAVLVGGLLGSTELWDHLLAVPALGHLGSLLSMALAAMVVLRLRLLGQELTARVALYGVLLAVVGVAAYLVLFRALRTSTALLAAALATVTLGLLAAGREVLVPATARRERLRQLAHLGRFAAQLAHDLRNPLAALKGTLQFLAEERRQGRSLDGHERFLDGMAAQVERMAGIVERYGRLSAVEARATPTAIDELVRDAVARHSLGLAQRVPAVALRAEVSPAAAVAPACWLDRDLVAGALDNLLQNAAEAIPAGRGGAIALRVERIGSDELVLAVQDDGHGLDPRQLACAVEEFFTTKAQGSGLGLAFVRRVAEAHGGSIGLESAPGRGTTATLRLSVAPPAGGDR